MLEMDRGYWDSVAEDYDEQIFDSIETDLRGVIDRRLDQYGDADHLAADFGCGVGKYVPAIARRFREVCGIDLSQKLLDVAAEACADCGNVRFVQSDLADESLRIRRVHFAVCTNVLIAPPREGRLAILRNIHRNMVRGGHVMVLVPSLESALHANQRLMEWNRREGLEGDEAYEEAMRPTRKTAAALLEGVIEIEGVATKHYLREEALLLLREAGFEPVSADQVEYPWDTEFQHPPRWMGAPYPWDWLVVARQS